MEFSQQSREWVARAEARLDAVLPAATTPPARLHEAMRYSVLGGGKRIRPILVYATGTALGVPLEKLDAAAAAVELIHAFSLVHDDLPAMDDDDLRRGRPTTHKAFDEATAILAADALQPLAFELLATDPALDDDPHARLRMIALLANACGSLGMTGGQSIDLGSEGQRLTADELEHMYRLKTGRLLHSSAMLAVFAAGVDAATEARVERFVDALGLAFQIRDDILDIEGETETIGKQQGADILRHKATWPALFTMDGARARMRELYDAALEELAPMDEAAAPLRHVARYIVERAL